MSEPMTDEELQSFYEYAEENMTEPDGSQCQWADYSIRCCDEIRARKEENDEMRELLEHVWIDARVNGLIHKKIRTFLDGEKP